MGGGIAIELLFTGDIVLDVPRPDHWLSGISAATLAADAAIGQMLGPAVPAARVAGAIDELVGVYLAERRDDERFVDTVRRTGLAPFKAAVYADAH